MVFWAMQWWRTISGGIEVGGVGDGGEVGDTRGVAAV